MSNDITEKLDCGVCLTEFTGKHPQVGDCVTCPECNACGYGTYEGTEMNYTIEWYPAP